MINGEANLRIEEQAVRVLVVDDEAVVRQFDPGLAAVVGGVLAEPVELAS